MPYTFRQAHQANAFHQFQLLTADALQSAARERGIRLGHPVLEQLERLDREGAFSPVLFDYLAEDGKPIFRDEHSFAPWADFASTDGVTEKPRPMYSPWQLLYLAEALELPAVTVSVESLLDGSITELHPFVRQQWEHRLVEWRGLEQKWRPTMLLLYRLQSAYGPSVKGTLTKRTVTLIRDPESGEYVDPHDLEDPVELSEMLAETGLTPDEVKEIHDRLGWHGMRDDPLERWHMLMRMAPFSQRKTLQGPARRSQDAYDAAEMVRSFYYDLTGELLISPDDRIDASDKSWKRRIFGRWPMIRYTRRDLAVELRLKDLHPHQVHLVLEGPTEEIVCKRFLEEIGGPLEEIGVTTQLLRGVGGLRESVIRAVTSFPKYVVVIGDREGDFEREVERMIEDGLLQREAVLLAETSFEESNFTDEEIIGMMVCLAEASGASLSLDAATLRAKYNDHRERADEPEGLLTYAIRCAGNPDFGGVRIQKPELAEKMADLLLEDVKQRGADVVGEQRPIVQMLVSIFRIT